MFWSAALAVSIVIGGVAWLLSGVAVGGVIAAVVVCFLVVRIVGAPGDSAVRELDYRHGYVAPPGTQHDHLDRADRD